ncbi:unnamed protein product [Chondrus crispus]|uniref:Uncharacterized protein n=1 Tax=Chondrus crispus TaxID=2769 RepID=R7Q5N0_CHOCR|nr:unnamed protein product [Chondrus crispus]CDF32681.1 unnamed protein product [Chondrus crispus]|eukprot:XP_005712452.1 unnamed protein product [Chondrus crispus]
MQNAACRFARHRWMCNQYSTALFSKGTSKTFSPISLGLSTQNWIHTYLHVVKVRNRVSRHSSLSFPVSHRRLQICYDDSTRDVEYWQVLLDWSTFACSILIIQQELLNRV